MTNEQKFPSEVVDLPSGGKIYGKLLTLGMEFDIYENVQINLNLSIAASIEPALI